MPFVTEEAWQYLTMNDEGRTMKHDRDDDMTTPRSSFLVPRSIMVARYPEADTRIIHEESERDWALVQELISGIRNVRNEYKVEPARLIAATVAAGRHVGTLESQRALIARLARVADDQLLIAERLAQKPAHAAALVVGDVEVFLPLAGLIDMAAERARLGKELDAAEAELARRAAKLGNAGFVEKAPAAVVQRERDGLSAAEAAAARLRERLEQLN